MESSLLNENTKNDIKSLFKNENVHRMLIQQIEEIFDHALSIIVIYQKLFIKIKHKPKNFSLHIEDHEVNLFMIKITKSFPLENSVRLYLLDGSYQPKIYDSRDLLCEIFG
jgi:hypothetical protein